MAITITHPITIKIDPTTKERVNQLAKLRHRTSHFLLKEAVSQYVDREEKRASLYQEVMAAWSAYQENGLHVSAAEVLAWLDTWGYDSIADAPVCHE